MDKTRLIDLLHTAQHEITMLRGMIDHLEPKAHAYDTIAAAMRLNVATSGGTMRVDTVHYLGKAIEELQAEPVATDEPEPAFDLAAREVPA